jgi:alkylated DNA nucleotide flippase Atl1
MPLFEIDKESRVAKAIEPTTFPALSLWERQDLEAWVRSAPEIAGGTFTMVTSEYDRFDRTAERLDVLGVVRMDEGHGRLVVVELKRDGTSTTVDLQAIKYAAYVAASQFSDVVGMYAGHQGVDEDQAREVLLDQLGGTEDDLPTIDSTPRIVLLAGDFRPEVTTTVLWLIDNFDMDIRCVRLQPFEIADRVVVSSELIIPLPEAEQYRLGVQRKRREIDREQQESVRAGRLLPRLVDGGSLELGQTLWFRRDSVPAGAHPRWTREEPHYQATIETAEGVRTLRWKSPDAGDRCESPSLLAARILYGLGLREGEVSSAGINGYAYWTVDGEVSLKDLAAESGVLERTGRSIDRDALRELLAAIPTGRWTTYGALATAIGVPGAAQSVAGVIAGDDRVQNAHRVLRAGGKVSPQWLASDGGGPEVARKRLENEGIEFGPGETAEPSKHWEPQASAAASEPIPAR